MPTKYNDNQTNALILEGGLKILDKFVGHFVGKGSEDSGFNSGAVETKVTTPFFENVSENSLYNLLIEKCAGSKVIADHYIENEQQKHPEDDRKTWIKRAILRLMSGQR